MKMWSVNDAADRDPRKWVFSKRDQINCISIALLLVEGLEIPMIWWVLPETQHRWLTAGLWQLDHLQIMWYMEVFFHIF